MAKIDPKEFLIQNKVLVGAYALALVPIGLWFVMVSGGVIGDPGTRGSFEFYKQQLTNRKTKIQQMSGLIGSVPAEGMPLDQSNHLFTQKDVDALRAQDAAEAQALQNLVGVVAQADAPLERWFEKSTTFTPPEGDALPDFNDYLTEWNNKIGELSATYGDLVNDEENNTSFLFREEPKRPTMRQFQKQFWIQVEILEALQAVDDPSLHLTQRLSFSQQLPGPANTPNALLTPPIATPGIPGQPAPAAPAPPPYTTITCQFAVDCKLANVSEVVEQLLSRQIAMQVTRLELGKTSFYHNNRDLNFTIDGRDTVFWSPVYYVNLRSDAELDQVPGIDADRRILEPSVRLNLTVEAYDFEKIEVAAPQPDPNAAAMGMGAVPPQ